MYDGTARLDVPRFDLLFRPSQYQAAPDATNNNLSTISALADPSGTLERMQAEQVAKTMADLKTDGIDNLYRKHALDSINDYQNFAMNQYKSNNGLNRLTLNGDQRLADASKYRELVTGINALKDMSLDYKKTLEQAGSDIAKDIITPEAYKAFEDELHQKMNSASGIGDLPYAHAVYNNFLAKNMSTNWLKRMDEAMKIPMENAIKRPTSVKGPDGMWHEVVKYDPLNDVTPLISMDPSIRRGLDIMFAGNKDRETQWLRERYDANSDKLSAGQMHTNVYNNMPGWEKNWRPKYRINNGEMYFTGKPQDGIVVTDGFVAPDGKQSVNPGDLFIPKETIIKDGKRYVKGVTIDKDNLVSFNPDGTVSQIKSGAQYKPVTVEMNDGMKNIIQSNYFKPNQEGYPDLTPWGRLNRTGGTQAPKTEQYKRFYSFKSSDPIDVNRLITGTEYILDGEKVKWDGSNFDYVK